ncbi:MAG: ribosome small subunit-dependent GTPase, partial [Pseudomonadota bacterium]
MQQALIVSSYGRQFIIEIEGKLYEAVTKGKKTEFVVGDIVLATVSNSVQAQIQQLVSRRNLLYRSDLNRSKIIASNLDQLLIVVAVKPNFNLSFLNSCLICAEAEKITPIIIVNKMDLPESALFAEKLANLYQDKLNYQLIKLTAYDDCQTLQPLLQGKQSLLIGQSGMGKSTITNQIYPPAQTKTATITKQ